ncbi:MAG: outer membrane lipoprotein-sorting protein [bacterium]|nr:outer membrane lipoprotein-sorting protein [bacterium]
MTFHSQHRSLLLIILSVLLPICSSTPAIADLPDLGELSRVLDDLFRSSSSHGRIEMEIITPHYQRTLGMEIWTEGQDYTLVRISSPRKERGMSSLKRENEMWNYVPRIEKTVRIPPSLMMGSWMGSDFTNDDLVRETSWEDDYHVRYGEVASADTLRLVYTPRENAAVTWDRVEVFLNAATHLPTHQDYYDEKGRLTRRMEFTDVRDFNGRQLPAVMTLIPFGEDKEGRRTTLRYLELEFDLDMPADTFSLTNLRRSR